MILPRGMKPCARGAASRRDCRRDRRDGFSRVCLWLAIVPLALLLICPSLSRASATFIAPMPANVGEVEIYLLTRGAGDEVYTKYGHTIIRVVDPSNRLDIAYNWGAFDFDDPGFTWKFLRGFLLYYLDITNTGIQVEVSEIEKRWLVQEKLNLTDRQKAALLLELNRESRPDQRYYRYLFFTDNCSTRPRDIIDRALGGKIAAAYRGKESGFTFRDKVMEHNASAPILAMGQDVLLSSEVDRVISQWEEMFVPLKLREYLLTMAACDDAGRERPGERLLSATTTLASYPDPVNSPVNGYVIVGLLLGIPALLGLALYGKTRFRKTGLRIFGLVLAVWGGLSGFFGLYLVLAWAFSEHTVVYHNANLWLFWPVDWYLLVPGGALLWNGAGLRRGGLCSEWTAWFARGHLLALGIYGALAIGGVFTQHVARVLAGFGPLALLLYGTALYLAGGFRRGKAS
ncbi:MAG: DUF4105 domain-containing protein [Deltaproteobacteria bacterium]|nr:DUF4105 domain-containing protein [Deltaproteobacteria bacterium]